MIKKKKTKILSCINLYSNSFSMNVFIVMMKESFNQQNMTYIFNSI